MINQKEKQNTLESRPPIVVVLGHVDHGKSSILEAVKDLKITVKESGGITQHIGAYEIEHNGKKITFIDTPGHEAFSAMRARGAGVADIAVLVVAAEDSVKPQTKEAILHAKKAGLPLIVAINKTDLPQANAQKVKADLAKENVLVESMGGKIPAVELSAKTKKGIDNLLEIILLVAEMEDLKADDEKPAEGVVVESYLDSQRGSTATLLLRDGTLRAGDIVGTDTAFGKVRIIEDFQGHSLEKALPSQPAVVLGFEAVPQVGEKFKIFAQTEAAQANIKKHEAKRERGAEVFLAESDKKILNLIIKADVAGSLEAIETVLSNLPQETVALRTLKAEVGEITDSDVKLGQSAKALVVGFRVKANNIARVLAEREKIRIMTFEVIYELAQGVRQIMEKTLTPETVREDIGKMKVLAIFRTDKSRQIVGGKVTEGQVLKGGKIEVLRNTEVVGRGRMINLQKNKKDTDKATRGEECGILYEGDVKIEEGDVLQIYIQEQKRGQL